MKKIKNEIYTMDIAEPYQKEITQNIAENLFNKQVEEMFKYSRTPNKDFNYEKDDEGIVVTSYIGSKNVVVVPETIDDQEVYKIGTGAFQECLEIETVILPKTVIEIGERAFYNCGVVEVKLSDGLEEIGTEAFKYAKRLESVVIPKTVKEIQSESFCGSGLKFVVMNGGEYICHRAFAMCENLRRIVLPNTLIEIDRCAFDCTALSRLIIPESVMCVEDGDFDQMHIAFLNDDTDVSFVSHYEYERSAENDDYPIIPPIVYCNIGSKAYFAARKEHFEIRPLTDFPNEDDLIGDNYVVNRKSNGTNDAEYGELDASSWNVESILRQEGYTVSQREGLSDNEREAILRNVISKKLMSRRQVIEHIELQISLRKNNSMYGIAISKWERDLAFLRRL